MKSLNFSQVRSILEDRTTTFVSLGTVGHNGEMNIAPVGSPVMVDENTITILKGPLNVTYHNLKENPEAVLMVVNNKLPKWMKFFLTGKFGEPFGYRLYLRLREEKEISEDDKRRAFKRFGFLIKLKGGNQIKNSLNKVLVFDILKVREITFH